MGPTEADSGTPEARCPPERWRAYAETVEREQVAAALRALENRGALSPAQRRVVADLAATLTATLAPAAGAIRCEGPASPEATVSTESEPSIE